MVLSETFGLGIIFCAVFSSCWSTSIFSHWNPCIWLFVVIGVKLALTFPPLPCFFFTYALGLFSCVHYCHLFQILPLILQALAIFASFLFICFFLFVVLQLLLFSVLFSGSYVFDILKGRSNTYCKKLLLWLRWMNFVCYICGNHLSLFIALTCALFSSSFWTYVCICFL